MPRSDKSVAAKFEVDVKDHQLTILRDDGIYRHLRFHRPNTRSYSFDILTWPGYLTIVGDMGDFVFSRTEDMFEFFRGEKPNLSYWGEKVQAEHVNGGRKKFSLEVFREAIRDYVRGELDIHDDMPLPDDVEEELEPILQAEDELEAMTSVRNFESDRIFFSDFWECDTSEWDYLYEWCCHAIPWGISVYDSLHFENQGPRAV